MPARVQRVWRRVRDAVTGRFVRREEAARRPESTVTETAGAAMTTHGGKSHMTGAITSIENVSRPGQPPAWGDTIRVNATGMPNGHNYAVAWVNGVLHSGVPTNYASSPIQFSGNGPVEIPLAAAGWEYNPAADYEGTGEGYGVVWIDNDAKLGNGYQDSRGFAVGAPA